MSLNRKLSPLIAGRTIQTIHYQDGILDVRFTNGSNLHIKATQAEQLESWPGHVVKKVRQKSTAMYIDFTDDTTAELELREPMSSVMLRDKAGVMEYAD